MGLRPETSLTQEVFPNDSFNQEKRLRVSGTLSVIQLPSGVKQSDGEAFVFAIGDACNTDQAKMAAHAGEHGELVANNIQVRSALNYP